MENAAARPRKIAIVAVHGVIPQPRYAFQDQVATELRKRLSEIPTGPGAPRESWSTDIVFPKIAPSPIAKDDPVGAGRQSIVRVHRSEVDANRPTHDYYDVIEAYWSPIDKGKTNAFSVLAWLLATIFQPANTTASYSGKARKALSDFTFVLAIAVVALAAIAILLIALTTAFAWIVAVADPKAPQPPYRTDPLRWILEAVPNFWTTLSTLSKPDRVLTLLGVDALIRLGIGAIGAYLGAQGLRAWLSIAKQRSALARVPGQLWWRRGFVVALFVLAGALLAICALWPLPAPPTLPHRALGRVALALVFAALGFEGARTLLTTFLAQFFGDVQIYCTHDENAAFFGLRKAILDLTERTIVETLRADYDRVYVFAHSLGSTIALDALMRIYNLRVEEGITETQWQRLRGFVTFGTALEKTKYFLDAYGQSVSATLEQWRNDYYGVIFTPDPTVLERPNAAAAGIYWANYWYFFDFIADRIDSYKSYLKPSDAISDASHIRNAIAADTASGTVVAGAIVAQNRVDRRFPKPFWHILHGDYLTSEWFWHGGAPGPDPTDNAIGALEIVRSREPSIAHAHAAPARTTPTNERYRVVSVDAKRRDSILDVIAGSADEKSPRAR